MKKTDKTRFYWKSKVLSSSILFLKNYFNNFETRSHSIYMLARQLQKNVERRNLPRYYGRFHTFAGNV